MEMAHVWQGVLREYADRLGVTEASTVVTLGEGGTPLIPAARCRSRPARTSSSSSRA
jgi:threonine synthase